MGYGGCEVESQVSPSYSYGTPAADPALPAETCSTVMMCGTGFTPTFVSGGSDITPGSGFAWCPVSTGVWYVNNGGVSSVVTQMKCMY